MKGFKSMGKSFGFPTSADTGHSGGSTLVRSYMRAKPMPKFAEGGSVNARKPQGSPFTEKETQLLENKRLSTGSKDISKGLAKLRGAISSDKKSPPKFAKGGMVGNSAVQRSKPVTEFDSQHGGKGPLAPGYRKGGKARC